MQTQLAEFIRTTPAGQEADAILRSCVHCGFCTATCPTYQLLGDELDGPRGRIYLIKQMLEGAPASERTRSHLDRCLTCRACETTCPSGVRYGRLLDIGRGILEERMRRPWRERLLRYLLLAMVPSMRRFALILAGGRVLRPFLPAALGAKIPRRRAAGAWPDPNRQARTMLVLAGCVQAAATPDTNAAAARLFDRLGIHLVEVATAGCCGALAHHLGAETTARDQMRRNIDAWWPAIEAGAEAIVVTASGCGVQVKDYAGLLADDPDYADKAVRVSTLACDPVEILAREDLRGFGQPGTGTRVALQVPCTLQHGQKLPGQLETLLAGLGFALTPVADSHLCCGSAGSYSLLQPALSARLREAKLMHLGAGQPDCIATANIGCQLHLQAGTDLPVRHWLELLDAELSARERAKA